MFQSLLLKINKLPYSYLEALYSAVDRTTHAFSMVTLQQSKAALQHPSRGDVTPTAGAEGTADLPRV
jgi:hypothetical protein